MRRVAPGGPAADRDVERDGELGGPAHALAQEVLDGVRLAGRDLDRLARAGHAMADHIVTFSLVPLAADRTLVRTTWLVDAEAVEGVDYDLDRLTGVWEITNQQDADLVRLAHRGIADPAYVPGPYGPSEFQVEAFINWYITRLRVNLGLVATPDQIAESA